MKKCNECDQFSKNWDPLGRWSRDKVVRHRQFVQWKIATENFSELWRKWACFKHSYLHFYYSIACTVMLWHIYLLNFAHIFNICTGKYLMYLLLSFQCLAEKITYGRCTINEWISFLLTGLIWENSKILPIKAFFVFQNIFRMCCVVFLLQWSRQ